MLCTGVVDWKIYADSKCAFEKYKAWRIRHVNLLSNSRAPGKIRQVLCNYKWFPEVVDFIKVLFCLKRPNFGLIRRLQ